MSDLMTIARRFLATPPEGEKGDKGEKPPGDVPFSPLSPFSHPSGPVEHGPANGAAEPWDRCAALRLLADADGLVERLGVDGRHPTIRDAAAVVASALAAGDMETLRFAVAEFTVAVRRIAAPDNPGRSGRG